MVFQTENDSIIYFTNLLNQNGYNAVPTQSINQYAFFDILSTDSNNKRILFECKNRRFQHDRFGDSVMEKYKLDKFLQKRNHFDEAYLVSMFTNVITISNVFSDYTTTYEWCPQTTDFQNNQMVKKELVHYQQEWFVNYV